MRRWFLPWLSMALALTAAWSLAVWHQQDLETRARHQLDDALVAHAGDWLATTLGDAIGDLRRLEALLAAAPDDAGLESALSATLSGQPGYARLLLIEADGRERLRVERVGSRITVADAAALDTLGGRDFFEAARRQSPGAVYVAPLEPDQRDGQLVSPLRPLLFLSLPLRTAGESARVLALALDGSALLAHLREILGRQGRLPTITDAGGDWLLHPDPTRTWGRLRGTSAGLAQDAPALWAALQTGTDLDGDVGTMHYARSLPLRGFEAVHGPLVDRGWWIVLDHPDTRGQDGLRRVLTLPFALGQLVLLGLVVLAARRRGRRDRRHAAEQARQAQQLAAERARHEAREQSYAVGLRLQSAGDLASLADTVLTELAPRLGATLGAFYAIEGDWLVPVGRYGLAGDDVQRQFRRSDSLLGEALRQHRRIELDAVPAGYLSLRTGLGESTPTHLLILPLWLKEHDLGAIEWALGTRPSPAQSALLAEVLPLIALHLDHHVRRGR